jgi:hypothetical protein
VVEEVDHKLRLVVLKLPEMMGDQAEEVLIHRSVLLWALEMFLPLVLLKEIMVVNIIVLDHLMDQVLVVEPEV